MKINELPKDVTTLQEMVIDLHLTKERLFEQVRLLQLRQFGRSSEIMHIDQLALNGLEDVITVDTSTSDTDESTTKNKKSDPKIAKRRSYTIDDSVETETIVVDIDESDKKCDCCGHELHECGRDQSHKVEYQPARLNLITVERPKYACRGCEIGIKQASVLPTPIPKSIATPSLLAFIISSKYQWHLPLYRIEAMLKQQGMTLSRKSMSRWILQCGELLQPLMTVMKRDLFLSPHIFTDDTTIKLNQNNKGQRDSATARLWVYGSNGSKGPPIVCYDFTMSRRQSGPMNYLEGYNGYLQADAYPGYDVIYRKYPIIEVACWQHAQSEFKKLLKLDPNNSVAKQAVAFIKTLYRLEREIRHLSFKKIKKQRRLKAKPILKRFKRWLEHSIHRELPRGKLFGAMQYVLNQWDALVRYCDAGYLAIDNNFAEREVRPIAVGRKNYLQVGSEGAGHATAVMYSVVETAKATGLNVYDYLMDVLERVSLPDCEYDDLVPYRWKKSGTNTAVAV